MKMNYLEFLEETLGHSGNYKDPHGLGQTARDAHLRPDSVVTKPSLAVTADKQLANILDVVTNPEKFKSLLNDNPDPQQLKGSILRLILDNKIKISDKSGIDQTESLKKVFNPNKFIELIQTYKVTKK